MDQIDGMRIVAVLLCFVAALGGAAGADDTPAGAPLRGWHLVREYPHDPRSFTEGLVLNAAGQLVESAGIYGRSSLAIRDLASGKVLQSVALSPRYFGEGTTVAGDRIFQLSWKEQTAFVYDLKLNPITQLSYNGQGWGLSWDGRRLIQSDGSSYLYFVDPQTFATLGHIDVRDGGDEVINLNELEYARGRIYANIWQSDRIAVIAPDSGQVEAWLDLTPLKSRFAHPAGWDPSDDVLNGIAYIPGSGHLLVTGKRWPKLFEIALDAPGAQ
jgi:glutamine cyclotransferase